MNGTIIFPSTEELAKFLKEFVGSTAKFTVKNYSDSDDYILTFTGGF